MGLGRITGSDVNFRETPGGKVIRPLALDTQVEILAPGGDWTKVAIGGQSGFVSSHFIAEAPPAAPEPGDVPPPDPGSIEIDANTAFTPDRQVFARRQGRGYFTAGQTTIEDFLASPAGQDEFGATAPSLLRVINAVSRNEGRLEAINSYDNAFLSFGSLQWTAGAGSDPGELAALLARLQQRSPETFETYFGSHGIGLTGAAGLRTGFLALNGTTLRAPEDKATLRQPLWAYRFWRAGHDPAVRACQVAHALARIDLFYDRPVHAGLPVRAFLTSEQGVALLLDEHVNRPGHVPGTLFAAIEAFIASGGNGDPSGWTDQNEANLLTLYVATRNATNMTDSAKRADQIAAAVAAGSLSATRKSFQR